MTVREKIKTVLSQYRAGRALWGGLKTARQWLVNGSVGVAVLDRREVSRILRQLRQGDLIYEKEVLLLPRLVRAGSVVVDVGANLGIYTISLARLVGDGGRVHSFEPGSRAFAQLRRMVKLANVSNATLYNCAVGDVEGTVQLSIPSHNLKFAHIAQGPSEAGTPCEPVKSTTLDAFCRDRRPGRIDLVKGDCEGGEYGVIRGAEALLQGGPTLLLEVAEPHCARFGYTARDLFDRLAEAGYRPYSFDHERNLLVRVSGPTFDAAGHTWSTKTDHLGNNNYVFIHRDRSSDYERLTGAD